MVQEGLITTRNLIDIDVGPLRRFAGILDSIPTERRAGGTGESAYERMVNILNFKELDVKEAIEPYHFPIFTITVGQSNKKKSRWGFLSDGTPTDKQIGFNNVADQQYSPEQLDPSNPNFIKASDRMDIKDCVGKRFGMVLADGEDGRPEPPSLFDGRAQVDRPTPAWTVYEIEGVGVAGSQGASAMDLALTLLDGKTLAEFNAAALANPVIRADTAILQAISLPPTAPNSFTNTMVTAGKVTKDAQDIFHKA